MNFSITEWYVEGYTLPIRGGIATRFLLYSAVYTQIFRTLRGKRCKNPSDLRTRSSQYLTMPDSC